MNWMTKAEGPPDFASNQVSVAATPFKPQHFAWRALARTGGLALSTIPRAHRFQTAQFLARRLERFLPLTSLYSRRPSQGLDGYREEMLRIILNCMNRLPITYDPVLTVRGFEEIGPGGALLLSGRFFLNDLFYRWLFDRGYKMAAVASYPSAIPFVPGTLIRTRNVLANDKTLFFKVRHRVAAGFLVLLYLDWPGPVAGWRRIDTAAGPRYISDSVMRFAERAQLPVLYCATRLTPEGRVITTVRRQSSTRAEAVVSEFGEFLRTEAGLIAR